MNSCQVRMAPSRRQQRLQAGTQGLGTDSRPRPGDCEQCWVEKRQHVLLRKQCPSSSPSLPVVTTMSATLHA